jgi:hypothetical protein
MYLWNSSGKKELLMYVLANEIFSCVKEYVTVTTMLRFEMWFGGENESFNAELYGIII